MLERHAPTADFAAYRSPLLVACGVPHLFTTAANGFDVGPLHGPEGLHARLCALLGLPATARLTDVHQVHGARVVEVRDGEPPAQRVEADGLVSGRPDRPVLVRTADCVPVLIARADGARVAAVHAGWRGLVAGVLPEALRVLGPGEHVAAVGPCLSTARFEVGPEVADAFRAADLSACVHDAPGARPHVDLRAAAATQLARGGVVRVDVASQCTWDDAELWSFRRDVTHGGAVRTGRLAALIAPRTSGA